VNITPCCQCLQLEDKSGNAAFSLRKLYEKLLLPFDDHSHKRAAGAFGLLGELTGRQAARLFMWRI
jgi:hypothetical protein